MRTRPASPLPIIVPAIYPVGHLPKCRSLLTISDGSSCGRTEMPMRRLWSDPDRAQIHIQRASDWANARGGNGPFGLGGEADAAAGIFVGLLGGAAAGEQAVSDRGFEFVRGANPDEIPYYQASKFELSVNLKTAKALGLTVPETLLASADKVIE